MKAYLSQSSSEVFVFLALSESCDSLQGLNYSTFCHFGPEPATLWFHLVRGLFILFHRCQALHGITDDKGCLLVTMNQPSRGAEMSVLASYGNFNWFRSQL